MKQLQNATKIHSTVENFKLYKNMYLFLQINNSVVVLESCGKMEVFWFLSIECLECAQIIVQLDRCKTTNEQKRCDREFYALSEYIITSSKEVLLQW